MRRRGVVLWGTVVVAASAAIALTVPAMADTRPPPGGAGQVGGTGSDSAPEVLAALQRDLHIDANQAGARLAKEAWARGAESRLRERLGAGYAGAWLTADAGQLMVGVTSDEAAGAVRAAGATPKRLERAESTLNTVKDRLDRGAANTDRSVSGWYVDVADNRVVIVAKPGGQAAANALAARAGAPAGAVRVVVAEESPVPLFDVRGADPFFIDNRARCSIGFSVQGGFVTAGHCGQVGSTTAGFNRVAQGTFKASSFPRDDFGVVTVNGNWTPQPVVNDFNGGDVPVAGAQEAPVGASVCRSGSTTGTHCGVIQAKNATVNYPEGTVTGLTRTNVCAEGGDSGGSWLSGDQAQGVTSGGSGDCTRGGTTFFQPLTEILQVNRLTLITTAGPGTPPNPNPTPTPSRSAPAQPNGCAGTAATGNGSLAGAGRQQTRPSSGFFRAKAGRQTGCLSGPADANFDLFLDAWTGQRWRTVARSTGPQSQEQVTFDGGAGFYRYRVVSVSGSGPYTIGANLP